MAKWNSSVGFSLLEVLLALSLLTLGFLAYSKVQLLSLQMVSTAMQRNIANSQLQLAAEQ